VSQHGLASLKHSDSDTFSTAQYFEMFDWKLAVLIGYHPLDGITNPKYKLYFLTTNFLRKEKALAFN
jgi:hypothetical protein